MKCAFGVFTVDAFFNGFVAATLNLDPDLTNFVACLFTTNDDTTTITVPSNPQQIGHVRSPPAAIHIFPVPCGTNP